MSTVGTEAYASERGAGRSKLELVLHLLANLPQSLLLLAPKGAGKTALMRQIQATAPPGWHVCYLLATPNHSFERILDEMSLTLRRPGQPAMDDDPETALTGYLVQLEKQGRVLLLLLDDAGVLMPGLLSALCRFARLHAPLKLAFGLRPEELQGKAIGDALALSDAHRVTLPEARPDPASNPSPSPVREFNAFPAMSSAIPPLAFGEPLKAAWAKFRFSPIHWLLAASLALAAAAAVVVRSFWQDGAKPPAEAAAPISPPASTPTPAVAELPAAAPQLPAQPAPEVRPVEPPPPAASPAPVPNAAPPPPNAGEAASAEQTAVPEPEAKSSKRKKRRH
ncbi:ATP-binding protein [Methylococcus sp. EFPC2]|uniref:ATP-binding protein n=1 Tax=Methylococcus sp. EFPC2 TaxID=2812648 RepID=UPI00196807A2|nr:ATP-binding protein [Methylococcus sp. EFPC2]QSA96195.1 ATP-binding protein [Methylococcus sp. EFPC2]